MNALYKTLGHEQHHCPRLCPANLPDWPQLIIGTQISDIVVPAAIPGRASLLIDDFVSAISTQDGRFSVSRKSLFNEI
jgi:hypothetical protein